MVARREGWGPGWSGQWRCEKLEPQDARVDWRRGGRQRRRDDVGEAVSARRPDAELDGRVLRMCVLRAHALSYV